MCFTIACLNSFGVVERGIELVPKMVTLERTDEPHPGHRAARGLVP